MLSKNYFFLLLLLFLYYPPPFCNSPWFGMLKVNELQEYENVSNAEINFRLFNNYS